MYEYEKYIFQLLFIMQYGLIHTQFPSTLNYTHAL